MRRWLFNFVYCVVVVVAAPIALWRWGRHGKRTPALWTKLTGAVEVPVKSSRRVWLHAVSVGEVLQVRPLLRELRVREPDLDVVLSTTTASGLKLALEKYTDCHVVPFPFDFSWAVARAYERIQPDLVGLVELELWPNFIAEADRRNIPLLVANGRLGEKSHRGYARFPWVFGPMFQALSHVCAQNETYADRFASLGTARAARSVTGSIKFDGLATDRDRPQVQELRRAFQFADDDLVFMAGSTHEPEEQIAVQAWLKVREQHSNVRLLLVPRHPERFDSVAAMVKEHGATVLRRSVTKEIRPPAATPEFAERDAVRLLDTVGELSACWGLADVAYVGGTLTNRGGQNMLEPAAYGCPVTMGPNVWNFAEIAAGLVDTGGAVTVHNVEEVAEVVARLVGDQAARMRIGEAAGRYAASQCGAATSTAEQILNLMGSESASRQVGRVA